MSPTDFKMSLGHLARKKNVSKTSEHVSQTFSLKNAKVSPRHLNMPLRHFA